MKTKLLPILLILLIVLNGVLIFMLINKPHQNKGSRQERSFLFEKLQFTDHQKDEFIILDEAHMEIMMSFEDGIKKNKDILFNSFSDDAINIDSLSTVIGALQAKKEVEVFRFFKSVRKICNKEQQEKFDKIINKAIKGGNQGQGQNQGPPREGGMPPPPPR
jgi:protein CpxP